MRLQGFCKLGSVDILRTRNKDDHLRVPVNNHKNSIIRPSSKQRRRQISDEIHRDILPWSAGHWQRLQQTIRLVPSVVHPLTGVTSFDILANSLLHAWPPVVPGNILSRPIPTSMSSLPRIIMIDTKNLIPDRSIIRDVDLSVFSDKS